MFRNAMVGEKVTHTSFGEGGIVQIGEKPLYPIKCCFGGGFITEFTLDGKLFITDKEQTLFYKEEVMFKDAKIGDRVWEFSNGWGTVSKTDDRVLCRPIKVKFDNGHSYNFTANGKVSINAPNQTLFWDEVKFAIPKKPIRHHKKWLPVLQHVDKVRGTSTFSFGACVGHDYKFYDSMTEALKHNSITIDAVEVTVTDNDLN